MALGLETANQTAMAPNAIECQNRVRQLAQVLRAQVPDLFNESESDPGDGDLGLDAEDTGGEESDATSSDVDAEGGIEFNGTDGEIGPNVDSGGDTESNAGEDPCTLVLDPEGNTDIVAPASASLREAALLQQVPSDLQQLQRRRYGINGEDPDTVLNDPARGPHVQWSGMVVVVPVHLFAVTSICLMSFGTITIYVVLFSLV